MKEERKLFCIGVGPGDPKLITLRGKELLESAEVVFAPLCFSKNESFALEIASQITDLRGKEIVRIAIPMNAKVETKMERYGSAYEDIKKRVMSGKLCVFLVEGDPLIYSTFNHILDIIEERGEFDVEIVPGISSFQLLAARLKKNIVKRDEILTIVTAGSFKIKREAEKILEISDTSFIMKARDISPTALKKYQRRFRVFIGELCGTTNEFVSEIKTIADVRNLHYFSTIMLKKPENR